MITTTEIVNPRFIKIDMSINPRDALGSADTSYDVKGMRMQFEQDGRMNTPPIVERLADGTLRVLQGFQRLLALNDILDDDGANYVDKPDDMAATRFANLKKTLSEVLVVVKSELTDEERDEIVFDHGSTRPLTRVETIKMIWAKYSTMPYEKLCVRFMTQISKLSTQAEQDSLKEKLKDAGSDTAKRRKIITTHFRGEVNDKIIKAFNLGPRVQKAMIDWNSARKKDAEFNPSRTNLALLQEALNRDEATGPTDRTGKEKVWPDWDEDFDGKGWTQRDGGNNFNKVLQKLIDKKNGEPGEDDKEEKPLSQTDLLARVKSTRSRIGQVVYKIAAGQGDKLNPGEKFIDLDSNAEALESIQSFVRLNLDAIKAKLSPELSAAFHAIAYTAGSSAGFEQALGTVLNPVVVTDVKTDSAPAQLTDAGEAMADVDKEVQDKLATATEPTATEPTATEPTGNGHGKRNKQRKAK